MRQNESHKAETLPERVLVVDDHPTNRKLLRATLEAEGVSICEAGDGVEALAILEHDPVEAVISDILMPNMDGYQLCHEVRRSPKFNTLPLIVYTNTYTSPGDRDLTFTVGADEYVTKPATALELRAALCRARRKSVQRVAAPPPCPNSEFVMKKYAKLLIHKLEKKNLELEAASAELEQRVRERTAQLEAANHELDAFCHSVSHDLRAPIRHIAGFIQILQEKHGDKLDAKGKECLRHVSDASGRMAELINDFLDLSRVNRSDLIRESVNLSDLARRVVSGLQKANPKREVEVVIANNILVNSDCRLLLIVLENLLGNAWKFTSRQSHARIEIGSITDADGRRAYYVRDNGAGFDMRYADKLFGVFQRMHRQDEFPGTGVGLATVRRIINRHGGRIWVEAAPDRGAAFFFTLEHSESTASQSSGNKPSGDMPMAPQETP
jgi:K+-sensing histidine kinase KdpD